MGGKRKSGKSSEREERAVKTEGEEQERRV